MNEAYFKPKDKIVCPNPECGEKWEGVADDYVIPGKVGWDSEATEKCCGCDKDFRCLVDTDGRIYVQEEEEE